MLKPAVYTPPSDLDQQIFEATVPVDHYLRRVQAVIDFERCREEVANCYSSQMGRPAIEPVLLWKLAFLQYHYNLSDREVIEQAQYNMAYRLFLGLSLHSELPHHTVLTVFRERLGVDKHQKMFDDIVAQAREQGLVKDRLRLKDATHVIANIAIPSTIRLVSETRQKLLEAVRPYAAERVAAEEAQAETVRSATADLSGEERLLQRVTHLRSILAWVELLVEGLGPAQGDGQRQTLTAAVQLAHKVLADRDEKAKDKVVSVHDPDARWGKHGDSYAGYLLDVAADADSGIVTAVNVLPANGDEAADATTLIRQEEEAQGNDVQALSLDGVGFRGSLLREWTDPQGLNVEVIVPVKEEPPTTHYRPEDFTRNASGDALTCPAGQTTRNRSRNVDDTAWVFRFTRSTCAACPLRQQCLAELPKTKGRGVFKSDYEVEYRAARAKAQTPEHQLTRRQHWRIERKLGEMVRRHGARQARYRGRLRVLVQALMTAIVVNVKRLVRSVLTPGVRPVLASSG